MPGSRRKTRVRASSWASPADRSRCDLLKNDPKGFKILLRDERCCEIQLNRSPFFRAKLGLLQELPIHLLSKPNKSAVQSALSGILLPLVKKTCRLFSWRPFKLTL